VTEKNVEVCNSLRVSGTRWGIRLRRVFGDSRMNSVGLGLMALCGVVGAVIGWRSQSKRMRWRSFLDGAPGGMSMEEFERRRMRMARVRRFVVTVLYAIAGLVVGALVASLRR
jgi:hypothetical protein